MLTEEHFVYGGHQQMSELTRHSYDQWHRWSHRSTDITATQIEEIASDLNLSPAQVLVWMAARTEFHAKMRRVNEELRNEIQRREALASVG